MELVWMVRHNCLGKVGGKRVGMCVHLCSPGQEMNFGVIVLVAFDMKVMEGDFPRGTPSDCYKQGHAVQVTTSLAMFRPSASTVCALHGASIPMDRLLEKVFLADCSVKPPVFPDFPTSSPFLLQKACSLPQHIPAIPTQDHHIDCHTDFLKSFPRWHEPPHPDYDLCVADMWAVCQLHGDGTYQALDQAFKKHFKKCHFFGWGGQGIACPSRCQNSDRKREHGEMLCVNCQEHLPHVLADHCKMIIARLSNRRCMHSEHGLVQRSLCQDHQREQRVERASLHLLEWTHPLGQRQTTKEVAASLAGGGGISYEHCPRGTPRSQSVCMRCRS
jgi:hypothetical protein